MTVHLMMCLYDREADMYHAPFVVPSRGVAFRNLSDVVNKSSDDVLALHPKDFDLCMIGTYDDTNCVIIKVKDTYPERVCNLADLKEKV